MNKNRNDESTTDIADGLSTKDDEQHFWRALQADDTVQTLHKLAASDAMDSGLRYTISQKPVDLTEDLSDLDPEEREHRRQALRSMLIASEARQQQSILSKMPVLAVGVVVRVKSGPLENQQGTILDADYIHSRALLELPDEADAQWIEFSQIGPVIPPDGEAAEQ